MIKTLGEEKVNIEKKNKSLSKLIFHYTNVLNSFPWKVNEKLEIM